MTKVLKLDTLCLLSKSGEFIYVLLTADEQLLRDWAEKIEYEMQLEIGQSDPLSLEPCDYKLRPLRLSKSPSKLAIVFEKEKELENFFVRIYQKELDFFDKLNPYEHAYVAKSEWQAYECFLDFLIANKIQIFKFLDMHFELSGKIIQKVFELGFNHALNISGTKLNNIWTYFKTEPNGGYSSYFRKNEFDNGIFAY